MSEFRADEPQPIPASPIRAAVVGRIAFYLALTACALDLVLDAVHGIDVTAFAALMGTLASVVASRRYPVAGLILVASTASLASFVSGDAWFVWTAVAAVSFCATLRSRSGVYAAGIAGASVYGSIVLRDGGGLLDPFAFVTLTTIAAAAAAGVAMRLHEDYMETLRQRALEAAEARDREVARRITAERLRIARDFHDVIGHEIAVVGMQLGAAEVHTPREHTLAHAALDSAHEGVQRILRETQQMLGVLRREDGVAVGAAAGVAHIPTLVQSLRAAGLDVSATVGPDTSELDAAVDITAYRVIQEALTNANKHGIGPVTAHVRVEDRALIIGIENAYVPRPAPMPRGFGLVGMRERVASVGGSLSAHGDGSRFAVAARLPLERNP